MTAAIGRVIPAGLDASRRLYLWLSVILFLPILITIYWPAGGGLDVTGHPIGRDFINNWAGPQLAFGGRLSTLFDLRAYWAAIGELFGRPLPFHNWGYPPFVLPLLWPLAQLPYFVALALWLGGTFALLAAVTLGQVEPGRRVFALAALALAPACLINAVGGQNGFLSATLLLGGILSLGVRPILSGVLFGLLTFKPQLGICIPFALLALGAWRTIAAAVITGLVLIAGSIALFGIEPWRHYLGETSAYQVALLSEFRGFYTTMMVSVVAAARSAGIPFGAALAVQAAIAVPVLGVATWAVRQTSDPRCRAFVIAAATPLITPYAFNYDLAALAAVLVWRLAAPTPPEPRALYLLVWTVPLATMTIARFGIVMAPLPLLAIFVIAVGDAMRGALAPADRGPSPDQGRIGAIPAT